MKPSLWVCTERVSPSGGDEILGLCSINMAVWAPVSKEGSPLNKSYLNLLLYHHKNYSRKI